MATILKRVERDALVLDGGTCKSMGRRKKYYHRWDNEGSIGKEREGNGEEWAYVKPMHGGPTMHLMVTGPQPWLTRIHAIVKANGGLNAVSAIVSSPETLIVMSQM